MVKKVYTKRFSSDPDNLAEVEKFILEVADEIGVDDEVKSNISLSVSEATSNAIVHGNKLDPNKFVDVKISIDDKRIKITIKDEGNGFDPTSIPDPTTPDNLLKDSGRGIHIMKTFLQDIEYNFTENGTEISLIISLI